MPRRIPSKFFIKLRKSTTSIVSIKDFSDILNPIVVVNGEISKFKQEHEQNYQHPFEASTFKSSIMPLSSRDNFQRFPYSDVYFLKIGNLEDLQDLKYVDHYLRRRKNSMRF